MTILIVIMSLMAAYGIFGGHVGGGLIALFGVGFLIWADRRMTSHHSEQSSELYTPGPIPGSASQNTNPELEK